MSMENYEYYNQHEDTRNLHDKCKKYMYYHVTMTMKDGSSFDGIIENVGMDKVSVLVGEDVMDRESEDEGDIRQYYGGYGRPRRRFRRFRRRDFPLASLAALALLPYVTPYPYYPYYPYPYY
ncbi:small nuclear ribonucleoprotein [Halobacillus seohaensis]|uniref:Small nuclear ribonucleoprotein n=1 Tax=Halobacillus seohaensis TaxID=447421 RepID=A0ABW2ES54_9BACI